MSEPCVPVSALRALLEEYKPSKYPAYPRDSLDLLCKSLAALCDTAQPCPESEVGSTTESQRSQGAARFTDTQMRAYQQSHGRA